MCGIAGFAFDSTRSEYAMGARIPQDVQQSMANAISHRGPDGVAWESYRLQTVHFVHRRLAIVDLTPTGKQPMTSHEGRFHLVFNGEIYNFLELKKELGAVNWKGSSDTEVLLQGFERWGVVDTINKCQGMFAIALFDKKEDKLIFIRDRFGEKPLYYYLKNQMLAFASELKALKPVPFVNLSVDDKALEYFLAYAYIPQNLTVYHEVQKVLPGQILEISLKSWEVEKSFYYQLKDHIKPGTFSGTSANSMSGSLEEAVFQLDQVLQKTISRQMIADVPVGSFLSGGIDSSLVTAVMQKQALLRGQPAVRSFTVGFTEGMDEAPYAKKIAAHLGTDHTELMVSANECLESIQNLAEIYDEPFADSSQIPSLLISKLTRQHVTVCLTGDAGDEVFGGYNRYELVPRLNSLMKVPGALRWIAKSSGHSLSPGSWDQLAKKMHLNQKGITGDRIYKLLEHLSAKDTWDLYQRLTRQWQADEPLIKEARSQSAYRAGWGQQEIFKRFKMDPWFENLSLVEKMMFMDTVTYMVDDVLVKMDRATMRNSLESRAPYLDHEVVEFAWSLPLEYKVSGSEKKIILRKLLSKYVPTELFERPKVGFTIPLEHWLRGPLKTWAGDLLSEFSMRQTGTADWMNVNLVQKRWQEHLGGSKNWQHSLWNILILQQWLLANKI